MKTYVFKPLQSIGNIVFGQEKSRIRQTLGAYTEFKKTKFSKTCTDDFGTYQVFYDNEDCCEAAEFALNGSKIIMNDIIISALSYAKISKYLCSLDPKLEKSADSVTSKELGISVYAPHGFIETMLFFKKGYFDQ